LRPAFRQKKGVLAKNSVSAQEATGELTRPTLTVGARTTGARAALASATASASKKALDELDNRIDGVLPTATKKASNDST
jgi:hypothetical protein